MRKTIQSFFITFILVPSILGGALAFTVNCLPLIWSVISGGNVEFSIKSFAFDFLLGFAIYFVYIVYKAVEKK
jgi:hypothetical protein